MKFLKALLVVCMLCLVSNSLLAGTAKEWRYIREGGTQHGWGPWEWIGYNKVDEDRNTKVMKCSGEGIQKCEHFNSLDEGVSYTNHINYVHREVEKKVIIDDILIGSGSYNFLNSDDGIFYYCSATWDAWQDEDDNYFINITITTIDAPEPLN
jgi:hypothetical protein